ncbi:unnamed protein product [Strongylus vulgaris]|uniref:EGF-like domain-containing protein n=1 Tax=Strongylus vulgaris TaxID=40348 RepID=A0A3P7JS15_STRVU|nr:unnamed protein product [Strongylus vulgaris]
MNNGSCSHDNSTCECLPGFTGEICDDMCPDGRWGEGCNQDSMDLCVNLNVECNVQMDDVIQYMDIAVVKKGCMEKIVTNLALVLHLEGIADILANVRTGKCICRAGFYGPLCKRRCPIGFYGPSCAKKCQCTDGLRCDVVTGDCTKKCPPGYMGERCDKGINNIILENASIGELGQKSS